MPMTFQQSLSLRRALTGYGKGHGRSRLYACIPSWHAHETCRRQPCETYAPPKNSGRTECISVQGVCPLALSLSEVRAREELYREKPYKICSCAVHGRRLFFQE